MIEIYIIGMTIFFWYFSSLVYLSQHISPSFHSYFSYIKKYNLKGKIFLTIFVLPSLLILMILQPLFMFSNFLRSEKFNLFLDKFKK